MELLYKEKIANLATLRRNSNRKLSVSGAVQPALFKQPQQVMNSSGERVLLGSAVGSSAVQLKQQVRSIVVKIRAVLKYKKVLDFTKKYSSAV